MNFWFQISAIFLLNTFPIIHFQAYLSYLIKRSWYKNRNSPIHLEELKKTSKCHREYLTQIFIRKTSKGMLHCKSYDTTSKRRNFLSLFYCIVWFELDSGTCLHEYLPDTETGSASVQTFTLSMQHFMKKDLLTASRMTTSCHILRFLLQQVTNPLIYLNRFECSKICISKYRERDNTNDIHLTIWRKEIG